MRFLLGFGGQNPTGNANGIPNTYSQQPFGQPPTGTFADPSRFGRSDNSPLGGLNGPNLQPFGQPPVLIGGQPQGIELGDAVPFQGNGQIPGPMVNPTGGGQLGPGGFGGLPNDPISPQQQRTESVFGPIGIPSTPLQRQATGGIQQFLNQPSPETRTLNQLNPGLQGLFQGQGAGAGAFGQAQNALSPDNPLQQMLQQILGGQAQGANPLPGNAQQALEGGLSRQVLGGGVQDALTGLAQGGGLQSQLRELLSSGGAGADTSAIQRELGLNPNEQFLSALGPQFQRNLDLANQSGGRFGSANAQMRSQAVNDYNLMASQALQQDLARRAGLASNLASATGQSAANQNATRLGAGQLGQQGTFGAADALVRAALGQGGLQQGAAGLLGQFGQAGIGNQQNAAQTLLGNQQGIAGILSQLGGQQQAGQLGAGGLLGQLAGQSGQNDFQRLLGGYGVGQQQANQNDVATQRNLAILLQQLGAMQQATLGAPTQTTPSGAQQGAALGGQVGALLALLGNQGGGQRPGEWP